MIALQGIRVLDLSKVLAGPLCGQYLGELGAEVIKVEPVGSGDDTRAWLPQDRGQSATFLAVNHNKRSLAVDLKTSEGRQIVQTLAAKADVVLQGFGSGAAARLGVDYDTLSALNPAWSIARSPATDARARWARSPATTSCCRHSAA